MEQAEHIDDWMRDLHRLGCGAELAAQILHPLEAQDAEAATALLRRHRQALLDELHRAGERVDLLDLLLYTLKKQYMKGCSEHGTAESDERMGQDFPQKRQGTTQQGVF